MKTPRAMCANCGTIYWRIKWRHGEQSGKVKCGVRTCGGYLWIFNDDKLGVAVARMDLDKRLVHAKLHVLGGRVNG